MTMENQKSNLSNGFEKQLDRGSETYPPAYISFFGAKGPG